ncbi:MAG: hypothetical protein IJ831_06225, partial [Spirochaetales bacterium]|nr:hypothetical protein [Spirochaetales bacterium]
MRYHTTLSTIVITMAMLLLFSAVAVFCVDRLNITSPGLMLLNKAQERLEKSDLPFSLSFSGIDRIMESEIVIHEAELSFEDSDISIERITVTQNPISLFSRLARREGSIRLELDNVDIVHMPSQRGNEEKSSAGSVDIDSMLDRIASIIEERTDGYLFNFDYEIVLNSTDIHIGKSIDMLDCYAELKIDRGLVLRNIYIDIPRMNLQFSSADISLEEFVASIDRSSSYSVDASFRNLLLSQAARRFTVDEVSAISRFDSLKDIEIRHFPFEGRLDEIHYSDGASSIDTEKVRATSENGTIRTAVDSFELATSDLIASTERLEAVIVGDVAGNYDLDIDSEYPILLEYEEKKL